MKLINSKNFQLVQLYSELKKCDKKLRDKMINEFVGMKGFGGYVRFFSHIFNIENTKYFRKSYYINQYLKVYIFIYIYYL